MAVLANLSRVHKGGLQSFETSLRRALRSASFCLSSSLDSAYSEEINKVIEVYTLIAQEIFSYGQKAQQALNQGGSSYFDRSRSIPYCCCCFWLLMLFCFFVFVLLLVVGFCLFFALFVFICLFVVVVVGVCVCVCVCVCACACARLLGFVSLFVCFLISAYVFSSCCFCCPSFSSSFLLFYFSSFFLCFSS